MPFALQEAVTQPTTLQRLYYAMVGNTVVLLLAGGDKSTQKQDIKNAKLFWQKYKGG